MTLEQEEDFSLIFLKKEMIFLIEKSGLHRNMISYNCMIIGQDNLKEAILYRLSQWNRKNGYDSNDELMFSQLKAVIERSRVNRGSLNQENLIHIAENARQRSYKTNNVNPLSSHKNTILASLRKMALDKERLAELIELIILYVKDNCYEKALEKLKSLQEFLDDKKAVLYEVWILIQLEDYSNAKAICDSLLESEEKQQHFREIFFYKGIIAFRQRKYAKAIKYLKNSILDSSNISYEQALYLAKAEISCKSHLDEAKMLLEKCIVSGCSDCDVYYELACLCESGRAIELLKKALEMNKEYSKARYMLAEKYRIIGYDEMAYAQYKLYFADLSRNRDWIAIQKT